MMSRFIMKLSSVLILFLILFALNVTAVEEYIIGSDDILEIRFWQKPELNATVTVSLDGKITLDIVGQIDAAGKTTAQLQTDIVRSISRLDKDISQATVRVVEYNHNYVFVIGQVNEGGKKSFAEIPDLWTLINEAGGVAETGDLSRVTIIRGGEQSGKIEVINVSRALAEGTIDQLPKIGRQDTIEIPRTPGSLPSQDMAANNAETKNLIYVIGAVTNPGPISYEENVDYIEALALAGGPTIDADLTKSTLILKDGAHAQTVQLNLEKYAQTGAPRRYLMQKEDMLYIPARRPGFFQNNMGTIISAVGAVTTTILLIDQLGNNNQQ